MRNYLRRSGYSLDNRMKKILLIAFKFPPYEGVGGFRWSHLSRELALRGYHVHVVTVDWESHGPNSLSDLVLHDNIIIHRIPSGGPHNLRQKQFVGRIRNGLRNKLFLHFIDRFFFFHDEAQRWKKILIPFCNKLLKREQIHVVVSTGHPFTANYYASLLRAENPNIMLVLDWRDLWFSDKSTNVSSSLRQQIKLMESYALKTADLNVTVTEGCRLTFLGNFPDASISVVCNGFSPQMFLENNVSSPTILGSKDCYTFAHIGNVASGREECLDVFLEYVSRHRNKCKVHMAGSIPSFFFEKYASLFDEGIVKFLGTLSQKDAIELLKQADTALHFNAKHVPEAASTKLYEYAAAHKPVLSINFGGEPERLITTYKWGISVNLDFDNADEKINGFLDGHVDICFNDKDILFFAYPQIAERYDMLLTNLSNKLCIR